MKIDVFNFTINMRIYFTEDTFSYDFTKNFTTEGILPLQILYEKKKNFRNKNLEKKYSDQLSTTALVRKKCH